MDWKVGVCNLYVHRGRQGGMLLRISASVGSGRCRTEKAIKMILIQCMQCGKHYPRDVVQTGKGPTHGPILI